MKVENNIDLQERGISEVVALGLAGFSAILLVSGFADYHHGQEFLRMPQVINNPEAVAFAWKMVVRGASEVGTGLATSIAFTLVLARQLGRRDIRTQNQILPK